MLLEKFSPREGDKSYLRCKFAKHTSLRVFPMHAFLKLEEVGASWSSLAGKLSTPQNFQRSMSEASFDLSSTTVVKINQASFVFK